MLEFYKSYNQAAFLLNQKIVTIGNFFVVEKLCELIFVFDCIQTGLLSYTACRSVKICKPLM